MLSLLRVRDFAIIEALDVELGPGLNVLTGETGAGKSILVHAIQLVLGARARTNVVRTGADRAEVEALFEVPADHPARLRLAALDLPDDDQLVIRRTVQSEGRSRATVNGRLTTLAQLRELATGLVDISSQHEHHSLVDPANHARFLDAYAELDLTAYSEAWRAASEAQSKVDQLTERLQQRSEREDLLRFQLSEIARVDPKAGELVELEAEVHRLAHAESLAEAALDAESSLYSRDRSAVDTIARAAAALSDASRQDPRLGELASRLEGARAEVEDVALECGKYGRRLEADPARLRFVEDRLLVLRRLTRRHGGSLEALLEHQQALESELGDLTGVEVALEAAEQALSARLSRAYALAQQLSKRRHAAASTLGEAISRELRMLGMGAAEVEVAVARRQDVHGLQVDGASLGEAGLDRVEFLIAPNPGETPRGLARVASGGELSRALLAIKRILASSSPAGVYVFDEVDTGVGGAVAEVIGRTVHDVARHHQVLCITHLGQIAAYAHTHLRVAKSIEGGRTRSSVERLEGEARVEEIARMVGGVTITQTTREAAAELVAMAKEASGAAPA